MGLSFLDLQMAKADEIKWHHSKIPWLTPGEEADVQTQEK